MASHLICNVLKASGLGAVLHVGSRARRCDDRFNVCLVALGVRATEMLLLLLVHPLEAAREKNERGYKSAFLEGFNWIER